MILRPMTEADLEAVLAIERQAFAIPWSRKAYESELSNQVAKYIVLEEAGEILGYGGVWLILGEGHVTNIAVSPHRREEGYGSMLMEALIQLIQEAGCYGVTLEVRESNVAAQNLYRKYGFEIEGRRKRYYSDNGEDAFIMWKMIREEE